VPLFTLGLLQRVTERKDEVPRPAQKDVQTPGDNSLRRKSPERSGSQIPFVKQLTPKEKYFVKKTNSIHMRPKSPSKLKVRASYSEKL
jgi:uncharacterized membrane protein